jgi:hypothetical protein
MADSGEEASMVVRVKKRKRERQKLRHQLLTEPDGAQSPKPGPTRRSGSKKGLGKERRKAGTERRRDARSVRLLDGNELLRRWRVNRATLPADFHRLLDPTLDEERRGDLFEAEDEEAQEKYAWAIPDERALRACAMFSPLVEMGAGAGYWARLLRDMGCEVHPFDCDVGDAARAAGVPAQPWTVVEKGGVEQLARYPEATLLILYPDDLGGRREEEGDRSDCDDGSEFLDGGVLSVTALEQYKGDTVIHVGEWVRLDIHRRSPCCIQPDVLLCCRRQMGGTLTLSMEGQGTPNALHPWGRSTDPQFQVLLSATFHKVLQLPLPNWGSVRNCLTVWKRTASVVIGGDRYAHVPPDERLDFAMAAPCARHLLA